MTLQTGTGITNQTVNLLRKGDILKVIDPYPHSHKKGDFVEVSGTLPVSSTEEWVKIMVDGVEVEQHPSRFEFVAYGPSA